jgi:hypothetical protein
MNVSDLAEKHTFNNIDKNKQVEIARAYLKQVSFNTSDTYPVTELCVSHAGLMLENMRLMRVNKVLKEALDNMRKDK